MISLQGKEVTKMKFFIDDVVEVVKSGIGISQQNMGKRTIITAINGCYVKENDAVQTKDFKNPEFGDWISQESFKLVS